VDVMGTTFVGSVIVPYSLALKKDASYASLLLVVRFACNFLANIYMPIIGDRCGRTIVAIISLAGSAVAYALQACAVVFGFPSNSGWYLLLVGKAVEGLFAGTGPAMMAYTMELSVPRMGLLRIRYAILIAMMFGEFYVKCYNMTEYFTNLMLL
jgi:MFS family permease